jgi:hypothetical protein
MLSFTTMSSISSYHIDYSIDSKTLYFHIKYKNGASLNLSKPLSEEGEDLLVYSFLYKRDNKPTIREIGLDETQNVSKYIFSLLN